MQLVVLAALIVAVVVASFVVDADDTATEPTTGTAAPITTVTTSPGFPPAAEQSVCRTLLTTAEAEALVGRPLEEEVIEPTNGQCAWPLEEGTPRDAELFLVLIERQPGPISDALDTMWQPAERFRFDPVDGLGDEASYVVHLPDPSVDVDETFAVSLHVYTGDLHVVLGNGARDIWDGGVDGVESRLRQTMEQVLARIEERFGGGNGG